jgi:hypothetical protein
MACNIVRNKSGVQSVTAPNGQESNLYQDLNSLPFLKGENDALVYHNKAQEYANDSYITDDNGEPVLMFRARSSQDEFGIFDKLVFTTSFEEAKAQDVNNRGIDIGFVKKRGGLKSVPRSGTPREFFRNTRNSALAMNQGDQLVSELAGQKTVVVTQSMNDFKPLMRYNAAGDTATFEGFANELINAGLVKDSKQNTAEILQNSDISPNAEAMEVVENELSPTSKEISVELDGEIVGSVELNNYLDGTEASNLDLSNQAFPTQNARNTLELAFARTNKPVYSSLNLSTEETAVWDSLVQAKVAEKMENGRYVLNKKYEKRPKSKNVDITISELIKNGTIQTSFNSVNPSYTYKGNTYQSRGALNKAVKRDVAFNNVSSTTSNNSVSYELPSSQFESIIIAQADEMFGTSEFLTFFEKDGKTYMTVNEEMVDQLTSPLTEIKTPQGKVEVDVQKELSKEKRGRKIQDVEGLDRQVENALLEEMSNTAYQAAQRQLTVSDNDQINRLNGFLNQMGVRTVSMDEYMRNYEQRFDVPMRASGVADLLQKVVVLSNEADASVMTEEVAHFALAYYKDQEAISVLLDQVDQTSAYQTHADNYRAVYGEKLEGQALEDKVRMEVLGKILAQKVSDNFNTENAKNEQESNIFTILRDLFNRFLDLFSRNNQNAEVLNEFEDTLDLIAQGILSAEQTEMLFEATSDSDYFFSLSQNPDLVALRDSILVSLNQLRTRYNNLRGTQAAMTGRGAEIQKVMDLASELRVAEASLETLTMLNKDTQRVQQMLDQAKATVRRNLEDSGRTTPVSPSELASLMLNEVPKFNIVNMIALGTDTNDHLDVIDSFLNDADRLSQLSAEEISRLQTLSNNIRSRVNAMQTDMNSLIKASVEREIVDYARENGASQEQIDKIKRNLMTVTDMNDINNLVKYLFPSADLVQNPVLSMALMKIRQAENNANSRTEDYFNTFLDMQKKLKISEGQFFRLAVDGSYFASPIHYGKFMADYRKARKKVIDKYTDKLQELPIGSAERGALINQQNRELEAVNDEFVMSKYTEKSDNRRLNRETANPITNTTERTQDAQRQLRAFSSRKASIYSRYKNPVTGEFTNNFTSNDLKELQDIQRDINAAKSEYDITGMPKTGEALATALDIQDYYDYSQAGGELSAEAKKAYIVARENAKAKFGETSAEFRAWESMFTYQAYPDSANQEYPAAEINETDLRDSRPDYDSFISEIARGVNTEGMSQQEITPTFLYNALREKKNSILSQFRSRALNNEIDGSLLEQNTALRDQVNIIERQLANLRGPRGMFMVQQDRAESTYDLKRVPNLSFKNKYNKLKELDAQTGSNELQVWLSSLGVTSQTKKDGMYPIPSGASYYTTYIRVDKTTGGIVPKEKFPTFMWESMTQEQPQLNPLYNSDLEGKMIQPSAAAMKKYRNSKYFSDFGISESNPWSSEATRNKDVFNMMRFFQDVKHSADRKMGLTNNYFLRPQVRKTTNEGVVSMFSQPKGTLRTWLKEAFVIDSTDEEFGERSILTSDGTAVQVKGMRSIPRYYHVEKKADELTKDIAYSMGRYMHMAYNYEEKANVLMDVMQSQYVLDNTIYRNRTGKKANTNNYADMLTQITERDLYGNLYSTADYEFNVGGNKVSSLKTANTVLNRYVKGKLMALNVMVPVTSYATSRITARVLANEGLIFTKENRRRARNKYLASGVKSLFDENTGQLVPTTRAALLLQHAGIKRDVEEMFSGSTLSRLGRTGRRFKPGNLAGAQVAAQGIAIEAAAAALDNLRLSNGQFFTYVQFKEQMKNNTDMTNAQIDSAWSQLGNKTYDSYLVKEGSKLVLNEEALRKEGFQGDIRTIENRAKELAKKSKARLDNTLVGSQNTLLQRMPVLGPVLGAFRDWFSIFLGNRLHRAGYDPVLGVESEGTYMSLKSAQAKGILGKYLTATAIASTGFNTAAMNLLENEDLTEVQKSNVRRMGADLRYAALAGIGLVLLYAWAAGDDGEEDESKSKEFLAYLGTRVFAEYIGSVGGLNFATLARQTQNIGPQTTLIEALVDPTKFFLDPSLEDKKEDEELSFSNFYNKYIFGEKSMIPVLYNYYRAKKMFSDPSEIRRTSSYYRKYNFSTLSKYLYKMGVKSAEENE